MPQATLALPLKNEQLSTWDDQLRDMPAAVPVLMVGFLPGDTPQPLIMTGHDLDTGTMLNILDVVRLQLKRQIAWDKVKGAFTPEE